MKATIEPNATPAPRKGRAPAPPPATKGHIPQAERRSSTQAAVLGATIACLVDVGYYGTTMERIAKRAKVSRGAMMHHYRDRADVIEQAASELTEKRLKEFEKLAHTVAAPLPDGMAPSLLIMQQGIELTKRFHALPSFVAMHELLLAARTDKELAKVMRRCQQRINDEIPKIIITLWPFWDNSSKPTLLVHDLVQFTFRGMAMSHTDDLAPERLANLRDRLAQIAYDSYEATVRTK